MEWCTTDDGKYRVESLSPANFSSAIKTPTLYFDGNNEAGKPYQSFVVRINKADAKRFVRTDGTSTTKGWMFAVRTSGDKREVEESGHVIPTQTHQNVSYRILRDWHLYACAGGFGDINVIKEAFCQDENVAIGSEVNKNPIATEELLELCADAALDGVSIVAVDIETGEVAAAAFNKIQVKATDESEKPFFVIFAEERCTQASSRSLINFMADVDEQCNLFEKYKVDCSLEIMFLATLRHYRCKGLATLLTKVSIDIARKIKDGPVATLHIPDLGPKYSHLRPHQPIDTYPKICQAIWTGGGTQRIGKALNFTVHLTVPFKTFCFNGKTYSERIGDESAFCEVAALSL